MSTKYTPTTAVVRGTYSVAWDSVTDPADIKEVRNQATAEFDRWLETFRAKAKAEALEEAAHDIDQIDIDGDTALWIGPEQEYTLVSDWLRNLAAQLKEQS